MELLDKGLLNRKASLANADLRWAKGSMYMPAALLALFFMLCCGDSLAQFPIKIESLDNYFPHKWFISNGRPMVAGIWSIGSQSHYEVHELLDDGKLVSRYVAPDNQMFWMMSSDLLGNTFIASRHRVAIPKQLTITAFDANLQLKWEYMLEVDRLHLTAIPADDKGGCYLAAQLGGELKLIHLDADGRPDGGHTFGSAPMHDYLFQIDMTRGGLVGFVTTRSEITGVVNGCTPDYDYLGFQVDATQGVDTLFWLDLDPYRDFHLLHIVPSPPNGKGFVLDVKRVLDTKQSKINLCARAAGLKEPIHSGVLAGFEALHAYRPVYQSAGSILNSFEVNTGEKQSMAVAEGLGAPQCFTASLEEDGIIWNRIGSDTISKITLDQKIAWQAQIPYPPGIVALVVEIGYFPDRYFVVCQEKKGGQQYYFELGLDGKWVK